MCTCTELENDRITPESTRTSVVGVTKPRRPSSYTEWPEVVLLPVVVLVLLFAFACVGLGARVKAGVGLV